MLDPPLGNHPRFLLEDEPFAKANAVLDEFLSRQGASQIRDPLKRAMLQHDLWAVFDVLAQAPPREFHLQWIALPRQQRHRNLLEMKLARAIRSLALSRAEIESLPDTYGAAINSGAFSGVLESNRFDFLPHDLFATNSGWLEIAPSSGPMTSEPQILTHTLIAGGRSFFRTFVKPPAGYHGTNFNSPRHPERTQFLLLREMICLDENWRMVPTHVVESIQFRTGYRTKPSKDQPEQLHQFAREVELSRSLLFQAKQGVLRPIVKGEPRARGYSSLGQLRDDEKGNIEPLMAFPQNCGMCHGDALFLFSHVAAVLKPARSASIEPIARWKQEKGKLDQLRKFILSSPSDDK